MEIILNMIWGLVAIWAFWFWASKSDRVTPSSRSALPSGVLALACALILLFPVISLTDDLHAELAVMEDGSGSVLKAQTLSQGGARTGKLQVSLFVASPPDERTILVTLSAADPFESNANPAHHIPRTKGRAPPV
jgi:hypothetical protein